jgi:hypothetical protein
MKFYDQTPVYRNDRGHLLVVEPLGPDSTPFLTVEIYIKWYSLYVVDPAKGTVRGLDGEEYDDLHAHGWDGSAWHDHTLVPGAYPAIARKLGVRTIECAYNMIVGRFMCDSMSGDPISLEGNLPAANDWEFDPREPN